MYDLYSCLFLYTYLGVYSLSNNNNNNNNNNNIIYVIAPYKNIEIIM